MHIIFPLEQLAEWEQKKPGSAGFEMMRCIQLLGGPVIAGDGEGVLTLTDDAQYAQSDVGVHWRWDEDKISTGTPTAKISDEARDAILMIGKDVIAFPPPSDQ